MDLSRLAIEVTVRKLNEISLMLLRVHALRTCAVVVCLYDLEAWITLAVEAVKQCQHTAVHSRHCSPDTRSPAPLTDAWHVKNKCFIQSLK